MFALHTGTHYTHVTVFDYEIIVVAGIPLNDVQEPAVKEAPADDLIAANDFKIKAFGADPQEAQINPASDVISSLERKESLPKVRELIKLHFEPPPDGLGNQQHC